MRTIALADWQQLLSADAADWLTSVPLQLRAPLRRKVRQLIVDDKRGFKLCLASQLMIGTDLPSPSSQLLCQLHLIYLLAWLAYGIYDDINDQEAKSKSLPLANYVLLCLLQLSKQLELQQDYQPVLIAHLQTMELANYQEMHLSIDRNYPTDLLWSRASGQLFAAEALADYWQFSPTNKNSLIDLLKQLLSILQIQDDLRDWEADFSARRMTYINQVLFQQHINHKSNKPYFYSLVLPGLLDELSQRIEAAQDLLLQLPQFAVESGFFNLILSSCAKILSNDQVKSLALQHQYPYKQSLQAAVS